MSEWDVLSLLLLAGGLLADGETGMGMDCNSSSDCTQSAYCGPGGVCMCRETYVPDRDNTTCLAGIREKCQYDDTCVPNAYCRLQERCECKKGYFPTTDLLHCKSTASNIKMTPLLILSISLFQP